MRELIIEQLDEGCRLLDVGCGTGDLLFRARDKISYGLGVDLDAGMIRFANKRKTTLRVDHLHFGQADINKMPQLAQQSFDIASSTLCLHEMPIETAVQVLKTLAAHSQKILIADFIRAESRWSRLSIEFDELISGHYARFRRYRRAGGLPQLADHAGLAVKQQLSCPIDGIALWCLCRPDHGL